MVLEANEAIKSMNRLGKNRLPFFFIIDFEMEAIRIHQLASQLPEGISFYSPRFHFGIDSVKPDKQFIFNRNPASFDDYNVLFQKVLKEINLGNSFLVNLTLPTPIDSNFSLSEIYQCARAKYKLLVEDEFVMFSPETFIEIKEGVISSFPMKGTIDGSSPDAAQLILNNPKEIAEHHTIVDLIRNDLSMVARNVEVKNFRYIDKINTNSGILLQVSSEISGILPKNYPENIGNILFTLLPAGSITGAPKPKTQDIIGRIENQKRGYYTGICGFFDGQNLESAVMIRFIENKNQSLQFRSGGGITFQSNVWNEYQELIDKIYVPIA
jgi:para-aminobenzoate synthetase component 1